MPNTLIDCGHNIDPKDITSEPGGATTNGIRVVIGEFVTAGEAHKCLNVIAAALIGDQIDLA